MIMSASSLLLALVGAASYIFMRSVYRLYFHPLSGFPGPKFAAISHFYEFYYDIIKGGKFLFHIGKLHEQYGPIVRINPRELHIKDPAFYDEIYASSSRKRDKDPQFVNIFALPSSMVSTTGHEHHRFRRNILNNFFSKGSVNSLSPIIEERVVRLMQRFEEAHRDNSVIQLDLAFSGLTADVITHYSYGKSWGFLEDKEFRSDIRTAVHEATYYVHINRFFPVLWRILRKIPTQVLCLLQPAQSMQEASKSISETTPTERNGPATIFEKLADPSLPPEERTLSRLQDEALVLLIAGTDTTARALTLATFYLARDPSMWNKLRDELKTIMPTPTSNPTPAQLEQLPYLAGTVNEALRMSFGLIIRLPRISRTDALKYQNYLIPPGTPMSMSTYFVHRDPTIFPDPDSFKPERWTQTADDTDRLSRHMVSFTKGSRACLGMNLAYLELFMTIAYMVRRFDIQIHDTTLEDIKLVREYGMGYTKHGEMEVFGRVSNMAKV